MLSREGEGKGGGKKVYKCMIILICIIIMYMVMGRKSLDGMNDHQTWVGGRILIHPFIHRIYLPVRGGGWRKWIHAWTEPPYDKRRHMHVNIFSKIKDSYSSPSSSFSSATATATTPPWSSPCYRASKEEGKGKGSFCELQERGIETTYLYE